MCCVCVFMVTLKDRRSTLTINCHILAWFVISRVLLLLYELLVIYTSVK